ncbi:VRR-NUC domain-containing protein [Solibaculum intestinale]|uniref:VRR-NUC domain-containing protein n=1 Tax=Solibaculum intestinale TaxID=3133165 RepID=A0ABV1E304_9FIRM
MKESTIESRLVRMVRERGGLCYKFVSPGNPGVPDRIVITPDGRTVYVELKTEIGRLANIQRWQIAEMRKRGADVRVVKGMDAAKAFVKEVFPDGVSPA